MLALLLLGFAREALGLALGGAGLEMGRFGCVFVKSLHVEGGLSVQLFLIHMHQAPGITKEVSDC